MSGPKKRHPDKTAKEEARKARLAAELKANLLKRKARTGSKRPEKGSESGETALGTRE
jgi:hypothetical protein